MKISNNLGPQINGLDAAKTKSTEDINSSINRSIDAKPELGSSAKVNLSERAHLMQKAKEIASSDTVDEAKVARLQALIDAGEYNVDAQAVADRLVDEHLLFPSE